MYTRMGRQAHIVYEITVSPSSLTNLLSPPPQHPLPHPPIVYSTVQPLPGDAYTCTCTYISSGSIHVHDKLTSTRVHPPTHPAHKCTVLIFNICT